AGAVEPDGFTTTAVEAGVPVPAAAGAAGELVAIEVEPATGLGGLVADEPLHAAAPDASAAQHIAAVRNLIGGSVTVACSGFMSPNVPIILDCDPGHDDAIAMVVAALHTQLLGITTVAGNAPLDATTRNAIIVRDLLGIDTPVHSGAARPLVAEPRHAGYVHGESGMDGADLPEPSGPAASTDAVGFIIETCRAHEGTWLVPTGPLTNIALALRAAPDLGDRIAGISLMGGGTFGNRTAAAEFNIWADPEAAAIVFGYGGPLIVSGLDLTHQFQATPDRIAAVRALPGRLAAVLADLFDFFSTTYVSRHHDMAGPAVHDPCAVLALTHPELFVRTSSHVVIETIGEHTRGQTVIDRRNLREVPPPNCDVQTSVDAAAGFAVITAAIAHFSG
ncbi:MAG: putative pyrimidine-specific ribonucleoside hydrolase, partial [Ilumatobacteraceae bacterium]|nr:putative pyrimidine-specific ribonucleoside hydrolase [Ilumatobacteraceae bacterium]